MNNSQKRRLRRNKKNNKNNNNNFNANRRVVRRNDFLSGGFGYTVSMGKTFAPDGAIVHLKYTTLLNLSGSSATTEYIFTGNGLYDPDVTGTGGQPDGFDQWNNIYTRYLGLRSSILIRIIDNSSTGNILITCFPTVQAGGVTQAIDAMSQPYAKWVTATLSTGQSRNQMSLNMNTGRIWGKDPRYDDLFSAGFGANPSNLWYWCINSDAFPASAYNYTLYIQIVYTALLYKRVAPDLSLSNAVKIIAKDGVCRNYNDEIKEDFEDVKISSLSHPVSEIV